MHKNLFAAVGLLLASNYLSSEAMAAPYIDLQHLNNTTHTEGVVIQSFTASSTNLIGAGGFLVANAGDVFPNILTISIWDFMPDNSSNYLASGQVEIQLPAASQGWGDVFWDLPINAISGNTYYLRMMSEWDITTRYSFAAGDGDPYAGGSGTVPSLPPGNYDVAFRTWAVDPPTEIADIAEPASAMALASATALLAAARRRRTGHGSTLARQPA